MDSSKESLSYEVRRYGTTFGVFKTGQEFPLMPVYDEEAAADLTTLLNWAAADRERHKGLVASKRVDSSG